jgi:hypothetical protein
LVPNSMYVIWKKLYKSIYMYYIAHLVN